MVCGPFSDLVVGFVLVQRPRGPPVNGGEFRRAVELVDRVTLFQSEPPAELRIGSRQDPGSIALRDERIGIYK